MEMYAAQQTGTFSARYLPDQSLSDIDSVLENHFSVHSLLKAVVRSRCDSGGISSRCYSGGKFHTYHGPHTNAPPFISSHLGQISLITAATPLYTSPLCTTSRYSVKVQTKQLCIADLKENHNACIRFTKLN